MAVNAVLPGQVLADGASTGHVLAVQADGSAAFSAPASGGIGGSTGATDNAVLRADGTDGDTLQASNWDMPDIYTASPNATVNHLSMRATGNTTNVSVSIVPKGTGSFSLAVPDGTTTGGNVRGTNAIDLQTARTAATQVASGTRSVVIGARNTASGTDTVAVGYLSVASGQYSIAIGRSQALGSGSICISNETGIASAAGSIVVGPAAAAASGVCSMAFGGTAQTNRSNEIGYGFRHSAFDVRPGSFLLSCKTTDATPTALVLQNIFGSANFTTRSGVVLHGTLHVTGVKSDGSAVAIYTRRIVLKNVGGTITLVESQTMGTDYEDNASTDLTISGTSPFFEVTGIASETWRWAGWFCPTLEIAYGT
ncbi:MAG: hypothetical protein ACO3FE_15125 [Planctomycetaceae bacterium]